MHVTVSVPGDQMSVVVDRHLGVDDEVIAHLAPGAHRRREVLP